MSWRTLWQDWILRFAQWLGLYSFADLSRPVIIMRPLEEAPESKASPSVNVRVDASGGRLDPLRIDMGNPPREIGTHICEVCGIELDARTLRTHDGHWRCATHKGVTCDTCGRELPPTQLDDPSWLCARHRGAA